MKWENSLYTKRLQKHSTRHRDCCAFVSRLLLILVINLFCFNNRGLFCLCYITKHLMTDPSGNMFVSHFNKQLLFTLSNPRLQLVKINHVISVYLSLTGKTVRLLTLTLFFDLTMAEFSINSNY